MPVPIRHARSGFIRGSAVKHATKYAVLLHTPRASATSEWQRSPSNILKGVLRCVYENALDKILYRSILAVLLTSPDRGPFVIELMIRLNPQSSPMFSQLGQGLVCENAHSRLALP